MFLKKLIPSKTKSKIKKKLNLIIRNFKKPKMVWGFYSNGKWLENTRISDSVYFYHEERIKFDDNVFVWHYTILDGTGGLEIGEGTQVGAWVGIFTHSSHMAIRLYGPNYSNVPEDKKIAYPIKGVKIGKYVFVGAGSKILPGVEIGDGCIISSNSVVTRSIPPYSLVKGDPAEVIGSTTDMDKKYLNEEMEKNYYKNFL